MKKLFPLTITTKIVECKDFYTHLFNFNVVFEAEWYIHLKHEQGMELALMLPNQHNQPQFLHAAYGGRGIVYSFEVDDAEAEYARLKELGAIFTFDLTVEEWGQKHFMLQDPAGVVIDVVEHLEQLQ